MPKRTKILLLSAITLVSVILIPIIGPFTFYKDVVPVLGPVLPRPDGVPRFASASFSWKGFGLFWSWKRKLRNGCAEWGAAKSYDYSRVQLISGEESCDSDGLRLAHTSGSDYIVFGHGQNWRGGDPCPFEVSEEQVAVLGRLVREAKKTATPKIELQALRHIEQRLEQVDGRTLTTDHSGGCNDLKPADYGK